MAHRDHAVQNPAHFWRQFGVQAPAVAPEVHVHDQGVFVCRPRTDAARGGKLPRFEVATGRWGLIPLFSPDGRDRLTHEAVSETAATERNFYQPWKRSHRCVVVADALFETTDSGNEIRIERFGGEPFCIAGLWNGWRSPQGGCVESFALLTIDADVGERTTDRSAEASDVGRGRQLRLSSGSGPLEQHVLGAVPHLRPQPRLAVISTRVVAEIVWG